MNNQPVVVAVVQIERNSKILLMRQYNIPNQDWAHPGGKLKTNEGLEECARREVFEELGVKLKKVKLVGFQNFPSPFGNHYLAFFFKAKIGLGEPENREPDKTIEIKWFKKKELPENLYYNAKLFFQGDYYKIQGKKRDTTP